MKKILTWTGNKYEEIFFDDLPMNKNIMIKIVDAPECSGPFTDAFDCPVHNPRLRKENASKEFRTDARQDEGDSHKEKP